MSEKLGPYGFFYDVVLPGQF